MTDEPTAREMIPALLDRVRPDRYDPTDKTWMHEVIAQVAEEISVAEARRIAATKEVVTAEATATRRTNRLLRDIAQSGHWPLDWFDALSWPLAVSDTERVALRATTTDDLIRFAERERLAADTDHQSRLLTVDGAQIVARLIEHQGVTFTRDLTPPSEGLAA